jgi:hypothetical protein
VSRLIEQDFSSSLLSTFSLIFLSTWLYHLSGVRPELICLFHLNRILPHSLLSWWSSYSCHYRKNNIDFLVKLIVQILPHKR